MQFIELAQSTPKIEEARKLKTFIDHECRLFSKDPQNALWLSLENTKKLNLTTPDAEAMKEVAYQLYTLLEDRLREKEKCP